MEVAEPKVQLDEDRPVFQPLAEVGNVLGIMRSRCGTVMVSDSELPEGAIGWTYECDTLIENR